MQHMAGAAAGGYALVSERSVPKLSLLDTVAVFGNVLLPTLAKSVIMRRPLVLSVAERLDLDHRAVLQMQRIRDKYVSGPLVLRVPWRSLALILNPEHVHRMLGESPEPFALASKEKISALAHFEPQSVLISKGAERAERRRFNEEVLDSQRDAHRLADRFLEMVEAEALRLCREARSKGELDWSGFSEAWFRLVRRVIFGDAARDDDDLSRVMAKLRATANWAFLAPRRPGLREELLQRISRYLERAEPDSLAGVMAQTPKHAITAPAQQVPQWLFAFDPAGMTAFRSLALLASQREYARRVREEIETKRGSERQYLPQTRALVLESLRLWPTSPLILRETTRETVWDEGVLPANTGIIIYSPFFHRDAERLPYANRFAPELWSGDERQTRWPLIPFSEGPGVCPGRNLVLLLTSAMIAAILDNTRLKLENAERLSAERPLPGTLNHFGLRFELAPRA